MKTTNEFLNDIKTAHGLTSDYQLSKLLEIRANRISGYRHGVSLFDEQTCIRVADVLSIDAGYVMACVAAERTNNEAAKKTWQRIAAMMQTKEAAGLAAALAVFMFLPITDFSDHGFNLAFVGMTAAPALSSVLADSVYYVKCKAKTKENSQACAKRPKSAFQHGDSEGLPHAGIATAPTHYQRLFHAGVFFQPQSGGIVYADEPH